MYSTDSLVQWKAEKKVAVWLRVPISLSRCAAAASSHGFTFHHAKHDHAVLALWLGEGQSRLPGFATHQVGVAGSLRVHYGLWKKLFDLITERVFSVITELKKSSSLFVICTDTGVHVHRNSCMDLSGVFKDTGCNANRNSANL